MNPTSRPSAPALAILLLLLPGSALRSLAQEPTLEAGISESGMRRIPVAVPAFDTAPEARRMAEEITDTLRADLVGSGYFVLVPPEHYRLVRTLPDGSVPLGEWEGLGAETVVVGSVAPEGDRFQVEARLFETQQERMILGRRYRGEADLARQIAHRIADEIVLHYTGQPGIATTKLAFVVKQGKAKEIFLMDYDGAGVRQLTSNGSLNLSPTWAPDGNRIALTSYKDGRPAVYILDRDGNQRRIPLGDSPLNIAPDWSPDGRTIAYSASDQGNTDIHLLDVDSGRIRRLTTTRAIDCCPSWSPNGRELAFTSDRGGNPQLYVMDAEGTSTRRLTYEGTYNESAAWSPRGDRIAFVSRIEGRFHLFVLDLATRRVTRLTFGASNNESPTWSPDGRHLAFASDRSGEYEIYRIPAAGGEPLRLTRARGASSPAWAR